MSVTYPDENILITLLCTLYSILISGELHVPDAEKFRKVSR